MASRLALIISSLRSSRYSSSRSNRRFSARYETRFSRWSSSRTWASISSKVMGDPPFSGLFLSVSAKMTQNGTEEKGGSRWRRSGAALGRIAMYVNNVLESEWTFYPYPPDAWNTIAQTGMRTRLEGTQASGAGESPAQDAN